MYIIRDIIKGTKRFFVAIRSSKIKFTRFHHANGAPEKILKKNLSIYHLCRANEKFFKINVLIDS